MEPCHIVEGKRPKSWHSSNCLIRTSETHHGFERLCLSAATVGGGKRGRVRPGGPQRFAECGDLRARRQEHLPPATPVEGCIYLDETDKATWIARRWG
jgi:hypothetical protein